MKPRQRPAPPLLTIQACPTCGSRVGSATTRCLVCGADLRKPGPHPAARRTNTATSVLAALLPAGMVVLFFGLGCLFILGALGVVPLPQLPTGVPSATPTGTETMTPEPTLTPSPTPPPTPLPPIRYVIKPDDSILALAYEYNVAPWAINELNNLQPDSVLSVGMTILIPYPSATPPPSSPSPTPSETPGS